MADFTDEQLLEIIAAGESDRVEFKESLLGNSPNKIREAICAFANDLPNHEKPGLVFVGVNDKGTIVGESITDESLRRLADMKTDGNILPPPSLTVEKRMLQGKEVAIITVQPSNSPPVRYKGSICIRTGPRRNTATEQDEIILNEKKGYGNIPFDLQPIPTSSIDDLDLNLFNQYLSQAFSEDVLQVNNRSIEDKLITTKMISATDESFATVLGILVVGKHPQDIIPSAYIQFLRINGCSEVDEIIDEAKIQGTIMDMLNRIDEKLMAHNRISVDILSTPTEKRKETYPLGALQQIVRNAVLHRRYDNTNAPVEVYWFNNRIEIVSPGGPFGQVTAENFGKLRRIDYRNPNLAEAMKIMGFVERFGFGIPLSRKLLKKSGNPDLEFMVDQHHVMTVIKPSLLE